jgi:hypothetical protein
VRFAIHFVTAEAMMILIVDHRSRFPEALLDRLRLRHLKEIQSSHFVRSKAHCNTERLWGTNVVLS